MTKLLKILLFLLVVLLGISVIGIKKYESIYIKNVADSAIYFQNPSRTLLKVSCLFDEAIFDIHKYEHHHLKKITKAEILLLTTKNLLKNKDSYKELIKIIDDVLYKIAHKKYINENKVLKLFHRKLNEVSFLEFQKSIEFFEKYKQDIHRFQLVLYSIIAFVLLFSLALFIILYQSNLLRRIRVLSETDQLTKAYNRRKFFTEISKNLKDNYSIIMFDIDHFKKINDTYGHDKGDYVLQNLIQIIKQHIRKDDMIFRWGGEEFFILFKDMNIIEAKKMAEKLRKIVEESDFNGIKVTISLSVVSSNSNDIEKVIKTLDEGLYEAKNSGRNRVVVKGNI